MPVRNQHRVFAGMEGSSRGRPCPPSLPPAPPRGRSCAGRSGPGCVWARLLLGGLSTEVRRPPRRLAFRGQPGSGLLGLWRKQEGVRVAALQKRPQDGLGLWAERKQLDLGRLPSSSWKRLVEVGQPPWAPRATSSGSMRYHQTGPLRSMYRGRQALWSAVLRPALDLHHRSSPGDARKGYRPRPIASATGLTFRLSRVPFSPRRRPATAVNAW